MQTANFSTAVWALAIAETIIWASIPYSFPALLLAWERDLGWSKIELSGAFTLALLISAIAAPVAGRLIDRGYGKSLFTSSALGGALLLLLLSQVTQIWQFYAVWSGLGVAMAGALYEPCFAILTRGLKAHAKQAITLVSLVAGFAATLSFTSAHLIVDLMGWRITVIAFSLASGLIAVPLIWHACTRLPLSVDGSSKHTSRASSTALKRALTPAFVLLGVSFAAIGLNHGLLLTHLLPLLHEAGIHQNTAVLAASMIGPMQVTGRLAMMATAKHTNSLGIAMACFIAIALAATALYDVASLPSLLIVFVLLQGAGYGVISIMRPVITAELLGQRDFGIIAGMLAIPFISAYALAPTIASLLWQIAGYSLVIGIALVASLSGLLALMTAWCITSKTAR